MSAKLQIANCLVWCRNVSVIAVISQRGITGHIIDYLVHTPLGRAVQSVVSHVHHFFGLWPGTDHFQTQSSQFHLH